MLSNLMSNVVYHIYCICQNDKKNLFLDPRTKDWFLVHSPWPPFFILLSYVIVSINARRLMKNVEAFNLKTVLLIYNTALVILSAYMCYEVCYLKNTKFKSSVCQ